MIRRIVRVAPWQAAKFAALLYFIMGLLFAACMAVIISMTPDTEPGPGLGLVLVMPFLYALAGLIFVPIGCWVFNFVAGVVGGLEVDVTHSEG